MKKLFLCLTLLVISTGFSWAGPDECDFSNLSPVFIDLLTYNPAVITKQVSSHDKSGNNDDWHTLSTKEDEYTLLKEKGEGKITRIWMTFNRSEEDPKYMEEMNSTIKIIIDGKTVVEKNTFEYFNPNPKVNPEYSNLLSISTSSYYSYVPYPYKTDVEIRYVPSEKGKTYKMHHYYHINYQEGSGASSGPSAEDLIIFVKDTTWKSCPFDNVQQKKVPAGGSVTIASGPATISRLSVSLENINSLWIKIADEEAVPLSYFMGAPDPVFIPDPKIGTWPGMNEWNSSIFSINYNTKTFISRLPIPLPEGQKIILKNRSNGAIQVSIGMNIAAYQKSHPILVSEFKSQKPPVNYVQNHSLMNFFERTGNIKMISLVETIENTYPEITGFSLLEGDEMIRTDGLAYPFSLGTGTEDYFNAGWYFASGNRALSFSGNPAMLKIVGSEIPYLYSLYRHHIIDPVVARKGIRFGFEAGQLSSSSLPYLIYKTLVLGYQFRALNLLSLKKIEASEFTIEENKWSMSSYPALTSYDAEKSSLELNLNFRSLKALENVAITCPSTKPTGLSIVRVYDAARSAQEARIRVNTRNAGVFYASTYNTLRRLAEDEVFIKLNPDDCVPSKNMQLRFLSSGTLSLELDSRNSANAFTENLYLINFWSDALPERIFEGEDAFAHQCGKREINQTVKGWSCAVSECKECFMAYGPYIKDAQEGLRQVDFHLLIDNNVADDNQIVRIDVNDAQTMKILASKVITRKKFKNTWQYQIFSLQFMNPHPDPIKIEFRTYYYNNAFINLNKVVLK